MEWLKKLFNKKPDLTLNRTNPSPTSGGNNIATPTSSISKTASHQPSASLNVAESGKSPSATANSIHLRCRTCGESYSVPASDPEKGTSMACPKCHHAPYGEQSDMPYRSARYVEIFFGYKHTSLLDLYCPHCSKPNYSIVAPEGGPDLGWYINSSQQNPNAAYVMKVECVHCQQLFVVEWDIWPFKEPACNYCRTIPIGTKLIGMEYITFPDKNREKVDEALGHGPILGKYYRDAEGNRLWVLCPYCLQKVADHEDKQSAASNIASTATDRLKVLSESINAGDIPEIRELIKNGADVNAINEYGVTPLFMASQNGYATVVKLLLEAKADVNAADADGVAPLFIASQNGHAEVIKLLLEAKADVNTTRADGTTPLFIASQNGHTEVVKLLLEAKADVNTIDKTNGITPLFVASQDGHTEVVKLLLEAKADVNATNTNGVTPLFMVSQNGHVDIVKLLLQAKADANIARKTDDITPLWQASQNGHTEVVKLLLEAKADVNAAKVNSITPLWQASQNGHIEIVKLLLQAKADANIARNTDGVTPLWQASGLGHTEVVKLLLEAKVDINAKAHTDGQIYTPLSVAKQMGHEKIINLLTEYGAKD